MNKNAWLSWLAKYILASSIPFKFESKENKKDSMNGQKHLSVIARY